MSILKIYHFHNGTGGGVLSVIKNLLIYKQHGIIENHVIYTINKEVVSDFKLPGLTGAASEQIFYYSPKWNFYQTCKKLAKFLPDEKAVIVAHDWIELGMVSSIGLQNPVVSFLHGDFEYYYALANSHQNAIDKFICVSNVIAKKLKQLLPNRQNDIFYKRFPVPHIPFFKKENSILKCIYYVRDLNDERKQFKILPQINNHLVVNNVMIDWTIAGGGMTQVEFFNVWGNTANVSFKGFLSNEQLIPELLLNDIFILPSLSEGFPVAVVEAMKAGLVPIITNWENATEELIVEGKTGFYCVAEKSDEFASKIEVLSNDRKCLTQMSENALQLANELFNPEQNTALYEEVFIKAAKDCKPKKAKRVYGSRLDQKWMPNFITKAIRQFN